VSRLVKNIKEGSSEGEKDYSRLDQAIKERSDTFSGKAKLFVGAQSWMPLWIRRKRRSGGRGRLFAGARPLLLQVIRRWCHIGFSAAFPLSIFRVNFHYVRCNTNSLHHLHHQRAVLNQLVFPLSVPMQDSPVASGPNPTGKASSITASSIPGS
jgi:hypothetical protein